MIVLCSNLAQCIHRLWQPYSLSSQHLIFAHECGVYKVSWVYSHGTESRDSDSQGTISASPFAGGVPPPIATLTTMADRKLPTFDELPKFRNFSGCAWEVWGKDDQLGTVNLLTEDVVKNAAGEIKWINPFRSWLFSLTLLVDWGNASAWIGAFFILNWQVFWTETFF